MKKSTRKPSSLFSVPLSLPVQLSQSYLDVFVLAFLVSAVSLLILDIFLLQHGKDIKNDIGNACHGLEIATNALASTPYFVAKGVNHLVSDSIETAKRHASQVVQLTLSFLKDLLLYILFRYQKVLQCLIYLVVTSGLKLVSQSAQDITNFVNKELSDISSALESGLNSIDSQLKSVNDATSHLSVNMFGGGVSVPQIPLPLSIPGVSGNLQWSLPNGTLSFLTDLSQGTPPTLQDLEAQAKNAISAPIDSLIKSITSSLDKALNGTDAQSAFNLIPLPPIVKSIHFCDGALPLGAVDKVISKVEFVLMISIVLLSLLTLVATLMNARVIWNMYRSQQDHLDRFIEYADGFKHDSTLVLPLILAIHYPSLDKFLTRSRSINLLSRLQYWILMYCSHPLAWSCIVVGGIGFFIVRMQLFLIPWIATLLAPILVSEVEIAAKVVEGKVAGAINQAVGPFVSAVNSEIEAIEHALNLNLFGAIKSIVSSVDAGILGVFASFQNDLDQVLKSVPPIESALSSFFTCVLGNVKSSLTSMTSNLQNNSIVNISRISSDYFHIDAASVLRNGNLASTLSNNTAMTGAKALFVEQLDNLLDRYAATIRIQSIPFLTVLLFGCSMILFGLVGACIQLFSTSHQSPQNDKH